MSDKNNLIEHINLLNDYIIMYNKDRLPNGYWNNIENRKIFLKVLEYKLNIKTYEDWYKIKQTDYTKEKLGVKTSGFFDRYDNSVKKMLKDLSNYELLDWKFLSLGNNGWELPNIKKNKKKYEIFKQKICNIVKNDSYWNDECNCNKIIDNEKPMFRKFFEYIWTQENIKKYEELYNLTSNIIRKKYDGDGLIVSYKKTYQELIILAFPEYKFYKFLFFNGTERSYWNNIENSKEALQYYYQYNNFKSLDEFYDVSRIMLESFGLSGLVKKYKNMYNLLLVIYPEHKWDKDKLLMPNWSIKENIKNILNKIMIEHYWCIDDLYNITQDFMITKGYSGLIAKYNGSPLNMLNHIYPEKKWYSFLFSRVPNFYWDDINNIREAIEWLCIDILKYSCIEDAVYYITSLDFDNNKLSTLRSRSGGIITLFKDTYPELDLKAYKFNGAKWLSGENGINIEYLKEYISDFEKENNIITLYDWYNVDRKDLTTGIYNYFNSLIELLIFIYPSHTWDETKFKKVYWNKIDYEKRQNKVINLGKLLGYNTMEDWYNITTNIISDNIGFGILSFYDSSPIKMLKDVYPEYDWQPWNFKMAPIKTWNNNDNHKKWLEYFYKQMNFNSFDDFYNVCYLDIVNHKGTGLLNTCYSGSFQALLKNIYPEHKWDKEKFKTNSYSKKCIKWLKNIEENCKIIIQNQLSEDGEYKIKCNSNKWKADGFYKCKDIYELDFIINKIENILPNSTYKHNNSLEIIFEFHGDFWHGNPCALKKNGSKKYQDNDINPCSNKTYRELYNKTIERENQIKQNYNLIIIWENDFNNIIDIKL